MRTSRIISLFTVLIIVTITLTYNSCSKKEETPANTAPVLSTKTASEVTSSTATCGGNVTDQGSSSVTVRGVCWSTSSNPTISDPHTDDGNGTGSFTSNITGLTANTSYYVRAYATNSTGTGYGNQISFATTGGGGTGCNGIASITDPRNGKIYPTIEIGEQCWLRKNMNYSTGNSWCYDNNPSNCSTYGRLYDWETALSVCPPGWHLPSDEEWKILEGTVDTQYGVGDPEWNQTGERGFDAGENLKSTTGWVWGNGTNISGFTGLPGGYRTIGSFGNLSYQATFWSSTETWYAAAWGRILHFNHGDVSRSNYGKTNGFSARCVQD